MEQRYNEWDENFNYSNSLLVAVLNEENRKLHLPAMLFTGVLMLVGINGNSWVLYITGRKGTKSSADYLIIGLAAMDLFVCLFVLPFQIYTIYNQFSFEDEIVCKVFEWLKYGTVTSSCFSLALIAFDRYVAICHPLKWHLMNPRKAKISVVMVTAFGVVLMTPELILAGLQQSVLSRDPDGREILKLRLGEEIFSTNNLSGIVLSKCEHLDIYDGPVLIVYGIMCLLIFVINLTLIIVFYSFIWRTMAKRKFKWQSSRKKLTKVLPGTSENQQAPIQESTTDTTGDNDLQRQRASFNSLAKGIAAVLSLNKKLDSDSNTEEMMPSSKDSTPSRGSSQRGSSQRKKVARGWTSLSITSKGDSDQDMSYSLRRQFRMAKIFLYVIIAFFIPWVPFWCINVGWMIKANFEYISNSRTLLTVINSLFYTYYLNNAINPLIYIVCSRQFREDSARTFSKIRKGCRGSD